MSYEVEVDTKLAELHREHSRLEGRRNSVLSTALHMAGAKYYYRGNRRVTDMTEEQAITKLSANPEARNFSYSKTNLQILNDLMDTDAELLTSIEAIREQNKKYTGWNRFFLVTSSNGHIHRSMSCSTCRWTTQFGWMPNLSGKSEAEAIKHFGPAAETLCSVCFPDAPTNNRSLTTKEIEALQRGETPETKPAKNYCPGSGSQAINPVRTGYAYGNWGTCEHCHEHIAFKSQYSMMLRKHEIKKEVA